MNIANKLTVLRIFLIPVFLIFLLMDLVPNGIHVAIAIFIIASITDALDGHLARSRNLVTNFGKFLDPIADKMLVCAALIALVELTILPAWVVIIIVSRDLMLSAFRMVATSSNVVIAADNIGKLKTIMQMIMIIYLLLIFDAPLIVYHLNDTLRSIGDILIGSVVLLTVASAANYIFKNIAVLKLENI